MTSHYPLAGFYMHTSHENKKNNSQLTHLQCIILWVKWLVLRFYNQWKCSMGPPIYKTVKYMKIWQWIPNITQCLLLQKTPVTAQIIQCRKKLNDEHSALSMTSNDLPPCFIDTPYKTLKVSAKILTYYVDSLQNTSSICIYVMLCSQCLHNMRYQMQTACMQ